MTNLGLLALIASAVAIVVALILWLIGRLETTSLVWSMVGGLVGVVFLAGFLITLEIVEIRTVRVDGEFYKYDIGDLLFINESPALYEGPHVFWQSDTLAHVASVCGQKPTVRAISAADTLRFQDPCAPSETYAFPAAAPTPDSATFRNASRVFAVSDGEGRYDRLVQLLSAVGVTDSTGRWTWGAGHLVLLGDFVDRGTQVTETLWFIHRLERAARQHGGRVDYVLGNHEAMLMRGDTRDADVKYELLARRLNTSIPGLYGPKTEIGRWMRRKPAMVRIDSVLFTHGGVSPALVDQDLSLAEINEGVRAGLRQPLAVHADSTLELLYSDSGPLWYRGYFRKEDLQTSAVGSVLAQFGVKRAVVGHTTVGSVQTRHGGRVVGIDVGFREPEQGEGLLIEDGQYYSVDTAGNREAL